MTKMFKLVTQQYTTHDGMKWEIGKTNEATADGTDMCSNQVLHCYSDPYLAVLFNPIHANIQNPILLEIECSSIINTDGLKHACKEQTPLKQITLPAITLTQRIAFAIKCALLLYKETSFVNWANSWLNGSDRDAAAARAAAVAAYAARDDAYAADAYAARAAAYAAAAADVYAARAAAYAADAYAAAAADVYAARAAEIGNTFIKIIKEVINNY